MGELRGRPVKPEEPAKKNQPKKGGDGRKMDFRGKGGHGKGKKKRRGPDGNWKKQQGEGGTGGAL